MPKLTAAAAKMASKAETLFEAGGSFEPLQPGKYLARLSKVETANPNKYGAVVWTAEFTELVSLSTKEAAPGRQWYRLTLPSDPKKGVPSNYMNGADKWDRYQNMLLGLVNGFFTAFGYTTDSDTDELIGEYAVLDIAIRTIQSGQREGERTNEVRGISPVPEGLDLSEYGIDYDSDTDEF